MSTETRRSFLFDVQHVVVAFDPSPFAAYAYEMGVGLASRTNASLEVVHAVPPMMRYFTDILFPYAALGDDEAEILAEVTEHARADLFRGSEHLRAPYPELEKTLTPEHIEITHGPVLQALRNALERQETELLICGAYGGAPPVPGQLGRIARGLAAVSSCPTLLAREPGGLRGISKVLVAVDGAKGTGALINWAVSAAILFQAELELVCVIPDPRRDDPAGLLEKLRMPREVRREAETDANKLVGLALNELRIPFPAEQPASKLAMTLTTPHGDPAHAILQCAERGGHELLVLGTHRPNKARTARLGRVADYVSQNASAHVLLIPAPLLVPEEGHEAVA